MDLDDLKQKLIQDIGDAQMSIDGIYYVVKDIYNEVVSAYDQYLLNKYNKQTELNQDIKQNEKNENIEEKEGEERL